MIQKCRELYNKYRELVVYLIVGVLTTIFSWGACFICEYFFLNPEISWENALLNTIGWVSGVCFAYPLNRKWVFQSTNPKIIKEFGEFAVSRLSTWILDIVIMELTVNVWNINYWIAKIFISSILVIVLNYVFSKLFIFKKK